jgi:hypothetical protein
VRLLIGFFDGDVSVHESDDGVVVTVGDERRELSPGAAADLRAAIGDALARRHAFVRTVGERRPDGSYVVRRRDSEATGNSVVFDSLGALVRLYERLPATVDAEAVGREGVTGSRRHLVVWHLAEHPAFDCELVSRSPLVVRADGADATTESTAGDGSRGTATGGARDDTDETGAAGAPAGVRSETD